MRNVVVVLLAVFLALPSAAFAQANGEGSRTPLFTRQAIELAVARSSQSTTSQAPAGNATQPSWPRRHPVLVGTLVGAGIGAGLASGSGGTNLAIGTGVGAGTGALVTGLITAARKQHVSRRVKVGLAAGVAGGIFLGWLACYGAGGCGGVS